MPSVLTALSAIIADPTLGVATFSLGQPVEWHPRPPDPSVIVQYPGVQEQARDVTPPVVTYTGNAGSYTVDRNVNITCKATDEPGGSGLAWTDCKNIVGPAYTFNIGLNAFSASAKDNAGNLGSGSTKFMVNATSGGICSLVRQWVTQAGVANSLCVKLDAATNAAARGNFTAKAGAIGAYNNELSAQSGKFVPADKVAILIQLAAAL